MADGNILTDFGINLLEEEIDDVIFQTNEFLTDATFTVLACHGGRHGLQDDGEA